MAIVSAVAKKVNGVVITSSPSPMPIAFIAITSASVPLFTAIACFTPMYFANFCSKFSTAAPPMYIPLAICSQTAFSISPRSPSYCRVRFRIGTFIQTFLP